MYSMEVWAYCLMGNHIHIIGLGMTKFAFARTMKVTQQVHAQKMNRQRETSGHLWQSRFYSVALGQEHLWNAVRYVELNPVRAGLVERAEDYPWSSARAHCHGADDAVLCLQRPFPGSVSNWASWLRDGIGPDIENEIRSRTYASDPNTTLL
jgi:putative transposase